MQYTQYTRGVIYSASTCYPFVHIWLLVKFEGRFKGKKSCSRSWLTVDPDPFHQEIRNKLRFSKLKQSYVDLVSPTQFGFVLTMGIKGKKTYDDQPVDLGFLPSSNRPQVFVSEISYESVSHTQNIIQNIIMAQDHKGFIGICCHDTKIPSIIPSQLVDAKIAMKSSWSPSLPWLSRGPTSHTSFRIPKGITGAAPPDPDWAEETAGHHFFSGHPPCDVMFKISHLIAVRNPQ